MGQRYHDEIDFSCGNGVDTKSIFMNTQKFSETEKKTNLGNDMKLQCNSENREEDIGKTNL